MTVVRDPNSLRSLIAIQLLNSFVRGSHGPTNEIVDSMEIVGYADNCPAVQVSQVRNELLESIGADIPRKGRGRMTQAQKDYLDKQLSGVRMKTRAEKLLAEYREEFRKVA